MSKVHFTLEVDMSNPAFDSEPITALTSLLEKQVIPKLLEGDFALPSVPTWIREPSGKAVGYYAFIRRST